MTNIDVQGNGWDLLSLCADLDVVSVQAGEQLLSQGEPAAAIYVLIEGSVRIERDGQAFATVDHPGALFGEMSTVMGQAATASVRANAPSTLRIAPDPQAFLTRPGVALAVLRLTATRLDSMTRYLADVRAQFGDMKNHLGMVDGVLETLLHYQAPAVIPGSARDPDC